MKERRIRSGETNLTMILYKKYNNKSRDTSSFIIHCILTYRLPRHFIGFLVDEKNK